MDKKRWVFYSEDPQCIAALSKKLNLSGILARILVNRGFHDPAEAETFLKPQLTDLFDPYLMAGMEEAVDCIQQAIHKGDRILIYGDFDADGITSTALLLHFFNLLNAPVSYYIPNRIGEGYSFTKQGLEAIIERDINLVISVDNGISSRNEVAYLRGKNIDVIITDHHEPPELLPQANAIVNPKQKHCAYPFKQLSGVGVAFKVAWAVAQRFSKSKKVSPEFRQFLLNGLAWVALGTITDLVPLRGENRILAKYGLPAIQNSTNPGLRALCDVINAPQQRLTSEDISYRIGPRINAAGRMGHVEVAIALFLTQSYGKAKELADELEKMNKNRQEIEKDIFDDVEGRTADLEKDIIISGDPGWHPGVIGVVASKLVEKYGKPAILFFYFDGKARGSCRSIPGFDIYHALCQCADLLETYGGHVSAGGLQILQSNLEAFKEKITSSMRESLSDLNLEPELNIDCEIQLSALSHHLLSQIEQLRPFGEGNSVPILASNNVTLAQPAQQVGRNGEHLSFYVNQGRNKLKAIAFNRGSDLERITKASSFKLAFAPRMNFFGGRASMELEIKDIIFD